MILNLIYISIIGILIAYEIVNNFINKNELQTILKYLFIILKIHILEVWIRLQILELNLYMKLIFGGPKPGQFKVYHVQQM